MLPFTFLIFPATSSAPLDRVPWYDVALFLATLAAASYLMASVRKAAELGWEFAGAPMPVIVAGFVLWVLLMEGLRRTGGWSLLLSVLPFTVYPLFADQRWLGPLRGQQSTLEQATAYHTLSNESVLGIPDPGLRRHRDRLPGVRHRADDDGCRQVLHQPRLRPVRHVPRRRRQGRHLRQRPARHDVGQHRLQRADRRHHDDPGDEAYRLPRLLCGCHRGVRLDRCRAGPAGDGRHRVRDRPVPQHQLRRGGARRHHPCPALLRRPVHAGRRVCRPPQPEGHPARRAAERLSPP